MRWWRRRDSAPVERRAQGGAGFTDAVVRALLEPRRPAGRCATPALRPRWKVRQRAAYARAFAVADVRPSDVDHGRAYGRPCWRCWAAISSGAVKRST